jgi:hypothetical protein
MVEELHGGHPGVVRMKALAKSYEWVPSISEDLEKQVRSCPQCQQSRNMPSLSTTSCMGVAKGTVVSATSRLCRTVPGQMFLMLVDACTMWLEVLPMSTTTSKATIERLRSVFAVHGLPERIVTNNGLQFTSQGFAEFLERNGMVHVRLAPYHPSSNGLAERAVQTFSVASRELAQGRWRKNYAASCSLIG